MSTETNVVKLVAHEFSSQKNLIYIATVDGRKFECHGERIYHRRDRSLAYFFHRIHIVERLADGTGVTVYTGNAYSKPKAKIAEALAKFLAPKVN